jgi:hypothetical protein
MTITPMPIASWWPCSATESLESSTLLIMPTNQTDYGKRMLQNEATKNRNPVSICSKKEQLPISNTIHIL